MAEPGAEATEATDDFVGDQQDLVFGGNALDFRPVGRGRNDDATGALDRFGDEGGDILLAKLEDLVLQFLCHLETEFLRRKVTALGIPVGLVDVVDARDRQVALFVHPFHAAERGAGDRRTVIGVLAGDHLGLRFVAERLPVDPRHAEPGVGGLRARIGEEDMVELAARMAGDLLGQERCRRGRRAEEGVVVGQFLHLRVSCIGDRLAAVADIDAPQAGKGVEILLAVGIPNMHAVGPVDDLGAGVVELLHVREGVQMMGSVNGTEIGRGNGSLRHGKNPCARCTRKDGRAPAAQGRSETSCFSLPD